jgi:gentisate 1,2-dioxygenase
MDANVSPKLTFKYDRSADILYIDKRPPYAEQESEEWDDGVVARLNPVTGHVENLEVLFFSTRLLRSDLFELPVEADLRIAA